MGCGELVARFDHVRFDVPESCYSLPSASRSGPSVDETCGRHFCDVCAGDDLGADAINAIIESDVWGEWEPVLDFAPNVASVGDEPYVCRFDGNDPAIVCLPGDDSGSSVAGEVICDAPPATAESSRLGVVGSWLDMRANEVRSIAEPSRKL